MIGRVCRTAIALMAVTTGLVPGARLLAQDSLPPVEQGVRVGITYTPGVRPGMLVLGGSKEIMLDSIRAILQRDLDFSDRFEIIRLPQGDSLALGITPARTPGSAESFVNFPLYAALGADYAVNIGSRPDGGVAATVYDVRGAGVRRDIAVPVTTLNAPEFRLDVHRASDEVLRATAGADGVAATRLLFVQAGRVYRIDADGADPVALSPAGVKAMSPAWQPGGQRAAFMEFGAGAGRIYILELASGTRRIVGPTNQFLNFTPMFSPDGRLLAFSRATDDGTDLYSYNLADDCCLQRLTVGRFSDNLSPTYSPDARRVAFVSTRAGSPQIYVMAADGTGQELFAPFDYGVTGSSNAPEWSPDGLNLAFHRDVAGSPQIFVMDVASRRVRQLTSAGRNEDPTWAPDGRHVAFVSDRTGSRQLWIIDLDTGRVRQVTRSGEARLPAWSTRIARP